MEVEADIGDLSISFVICIMVMDMIMVTSLIIPIFAVEWLVMIIDQNSDSKLFGEHLNAPEQKLKADIAAGDKLTSA